MVETDNNTVDAAKEDAITGTSECCVTTSKPNISSEPKPDEKNGLYLLGTGLYSPPLIFVQYFEHILSSSVGTSLNRSSTELFIQCIHASF